jgi:hypothetical protein
MGSLAYLAVGAVCGFIAEPAALGGHRQVCDPDEPRSHLNP